MLLCIFYLSNRQKLYILAGKLEIRKFFCTLLNLPDDLILVLRVGFQKWLKKWGYPWGFARQLGHVEGTIFFLEILCSSEVIHLKGSYVCAGDAKGEKVLRALSNSGLLHPGGIATSVRETGEQWFVPVLNILNNYIPGKERN